MSALTMHSMKYQCRYREIICEKIMHTNCLWANIMKISCHENFLFTVIDIAANFSIATIISGMFQATCTMKIVLTIQDISL